MKYLLDTNAWISLMNAEHGPVSLRVSRLNPSAIFACSVVWTELHFGAWLSRDPQATLQMQAAIVARHVSLPFDDAAAHSAAIVRAELKRLGTPIGAYDLLIAGIALSRNLTLVTANVREFSRVPGLRWENWEDPAAPSLHS